MAVHHVTVTLTGAAQALVPQSGSNPTINCKEVQIQGESGGAAVFIGGIGVTTTDYGQTIAATSVTPVILRPNGGHAINLASTYVIGTQNNKIHVLYIQ